VHGRQCIVSCSVPLAQLVPTNCVREREGLRGHEFCGPGATPTSCKDAAHTREQTRVPTYPPACALPPHYIGWRRAPAHGAGGHHACQSDCLLCCRWEPSPTPFPTDPVPAGPRTAGRLRIRHLARKLGILDAQNTRGSHTPPPPPLLRVRMTCAAKLRPVRPACEAGASRWWASAAGRRDKG